MPAELLCHIASYLNNTDWAQLAFAWKSFLVTFAQTIDPNNALRTQLQRTCVRRDHFTVLLVHRMHGPSNENFGNTNFAMDEEQIKSGQHDDNECVNANAKISRN
jgi:hypothetical protein